MSLTSVSFIQGMSFGLEFVDEQIDEFVDSIVFDLFILRFIFAVQ